MPGLLTPAVLEGLETTLGVAVVGVCKPNLADLDADGTFVFILEGGWIFDEAFPCLDDLEPLLKSCITLEDSAWSLLRNSGIIIIHTSHIFEG